MAHGILISDIPVAQTYSEILEFFKDKNRFAQGYYTFNKDGLQCGISDAYSYCTLGAIQKFTFDNAFKAQCCLQRVSYYLYNDVIQSVNDSEGGYEKVIKALEFAKELWTGYEPTEVDLCLLVPELLEKRNGKSKL
jgi:hypothetical protein